MTLIFVSNSHIWHVPEWGFGGQGRRVVRNGGIRIRGPGAEGFIFGIRLTLGIGLGGRNEIWEGG